MKRRRRGDKSRPSAHARTLVASTHQARKARILTLSFTLAAQLSLAWLALCRCENAVIVAAVTTPVALGLLVYLARYVVLLEVNGEALILRTAALFGDPEHRIPLERVVSTRHHEGKVSFYNTPRVDAPWITLRVAGYRIPFVLDEQAEVFKAKEIFALQRRQPPR